MSVDKIPEGKKWQKVCHDDSTPPYDSYCTFCSGSKNCYSEDFRLANIDEPNEIHINTIQRQKEDAEKFNAGVDACIEAAKKEFDYWDTEGGTVTMGDLRFNLNLLFEQLKKPKQ